MNIRPEWLEERRPFSDGKRAHCVELLLHARFVQAMWASRRDAERRCPEVTHKSVLCDMFYLRVRRLCLHVKDEALRDESKCAKREKRHSPCPLQLVSEVGKGFELQRRYETRLLGEMEVGYVLRDSLKAWVFAELLKSRNLPIL